MNFEEYLRELKLQKVKVKTEIETAGASQELILILGCVEMQVGLVQNLVLKNVKNELNED